MNYCFIWLKHIKLYQFDRQSVKAVIAFVKSFPASSTSCRHEKSSHSNVTSLTSFLALFLIFCNGVSISLMFPF